MRIDDEVLKEPLEHWGNTKKRNLIHKKYWNYLSFEVNKVERLLKKATKNNQIKRVRSFQPIFQVKKGRNKRTNLVSNLFY